MPTRHDKRYKRFFSHPDIARALLEYFVDEDFVRELDTSTLRLVDKQFVDEEHEKKESDLIYRVNLKGEEVYIYILMEFQSTVDRRMGLRMLRYLAGVYEWLEQSNKRRKLPAVFPLVLYNGASPWTARINTADLIRADIPVENIPRFQYHLIAVNNLDDAVLKQGRSVVDLALFIEKSRDLKAFSREIKKLFRLLHEKEPRLSRELAAFVSALFSRSGDPHPIVEELEKIEEAEAMITQALKEHDKEIAALNFQKGIEKGVQEDKKNTARRMIKKGFSPNEIVELTALTLDEIKALQQS